MIDRCAMLRIHRCMGQPLLHGLTYWVQGRYVSVLRLQGILHAIDSICFHAGGPLVRATCSLHEVHGCPVMTVLYKGQYGQKVQ